jgi:3-deoxy-7-phosphoheptulonate synthase/chorismate mutase
MDKLAVLRKELDSINEDLLQLLNQRAAVVQQIGEYKEHQGVKRFDPVREQQMLEELVKKNQGPFDDNTIRHLFKQIFQASLELQEDESKKALLVSRQRKNRDTVVEVRGVAVGNGAPVMVAGPCSVETEEQVEAVAAVLAKKGIKLMRGGAFKPRTSPYDFQGLGVEGLKLLKAAADRYGLRVISEIVNPADLETALDYVDVVQIGARNMQNFELLKQAGELRIPILLKRGLSATLEEYKYAAEYIMSRGNEQVILCERGIRTYEKATRNTLDISAVPILKKETHLPVLVDVTHAAGRRDILAPLAKAALAVGADGLMVEVHPHPATALSDTQQQLDFDQFDAFLNQLETSGLMPSLAKV